MKGKYEKDKYECPHCPEGSQPGGSLETSEHLMECSVYADLREGSNPELVLEDRSSYLRKVIQRRKILGYFTNYATCPWLSLFCPWLSLVRPCLSLVSPRMSLVCPITPCLV